MPVAIKGSGGGSVTLDAGAAAADSVLTLPNVSGTVLTTGAAVTAAQGGTGLTSPGTSGNVLTSNGSAWTSAAPAASVPSPSAIGQVPFSTNGSTWTATQKIVQATAQASTSGTSIDFTGVPSWVKRVTVMLVGVSTSATSPVQIQLGTSGGPTTSGYLGTVYGLGASGVLTAYSAGFLVDASSTAAAASIRNGQFIFDLVTGNTWVGNGTVGLSNANYFATGAGSIALSSALTQVRITTVNGTDTFDAGSINIMYE